MSGEDPQEAAGLLLNQAEEHVIYVNGRDIITREGVSSVPGNSVSLLRDGKTWTSHLIYLNRHHEHCTKPTFVPARERRPVKHGPRPCWATRTGS